MAHQAADSRPLPVMKRRSIAPASEPLMRSRQFEPAQALPLVLEPAVRGIALVEWIDANRPWLDRMIIEHGGVLFRGCGIATVAAFQDAMRHASSELLEYKERSSPRHQVEGNIYSSTDHPPDQEIFLHNENSYQGTWPRTIGFCCLQPSAEGGETPIADCRKVMARLDPAIIAAFARRGCMYVRNFGDGFGLPWQTVFQTEDPAVVEEHCHARGMTVEWKEDGRLRTRVRRAALARHPITGERLWFNHVTFFHVSTLEPKIRQFLLSYFAEEDLPTNTYYGDGGEIEPDVLDALRDAYHQETVAFRWERGDVLLLDNMLVAHGRRPYAGERKVVVGMADPVEAAPIDANLADPDPAD